jgi:xanthine dehydrogenase YagS FAD-binding subunit
MQPFTYLRVVDEEGALAAARAGRVAFIAGGTNLVDLMKLGVMQPATLVDISGLPLAQIEPHEGGVRIGAMARNSDVAYHPLVAARYPALAEALLAGASPQVRNMATIGGNALQRTRCTYFRDAAAPCNKRSPGSGCAAQGGWNRMHAILGGSGKCIAAHPSDMCVALVALDAVVHTRGPAAGATRRFPITDLHVVPGEHPEVETILENGELITHVELPATPFAARSHYRKVRDRASFAFALASAAVALHVVGGRIRDARVALGGVATKPWRSLEAEQILVGKAPSSALYKAAAAAAVAGAQPRRGNTFKVELAQRTIVRALAEVGGTT